MNFRFDNDNDFFGMYDSLDGSITINLKTIYNDFLDKYFFDIENALISKINNVIYEEKVHKLITELKEEFTSNQQDEIAMKIMRDWVEFDKITTFEELS